MYTPLAIDTYFDRIFYINLKREQNRNERIQQQFAAWKITNYERIEAAELHELPDSRFYRNFNKFDQKYLIGSLSCRASHIECIRIARERSYSKILILEDDIVFLDNPHLLLNINHEILHDWDMLYFGGLVEPFFRNQVVGGYAYAVRETLFDNIIYMAETSGMEIDNFYAKVLQHMSYNYNQSGKYNIRLINPFNVIYYDASLPSAIR